MTTENNFTEAMANRSCAQLHEIVGKLRNEYDPETVAAKEIGKCRGLLEMSQMRANGGNEF